MFDTTNQIYIQLYMYYIWIDHDLKVNAKCLFCRRQISTQHKLASNQSLQLCSDGRETVGMQGLTLLY